MNVLLTAPNSQEPLAQTAPQGPAAAVTAIRAARKVGEGDQQQHQLRTHQATPEEQEDVISRLGRGGQSESDLPLRGRRAVAAYGALDRENERAYMKQVLGFEVSI